MNNKLYMIGVVWIRRHRLCLITITFWFAACSQFPIFNTCLVFAFQIFPPSHDSSPSIWFSERIWADCPPVSHLSRCQQLHQDGGRNRRLSTHWIWIQQIQVGVQTKLSLNPQILSGLLRYFLYQSLLLLDTISKTWLLGRSTSCWSGSRSNTWSCSSSKKR